MIGHFIVTHCQLGEALIEASEFIIGFRPEKTESVSIDLNVSAEKLRKAIYAGIKKVGQEEGVLILTDMFGGTPSNLSYTFLEEGRIEVVSGVNLPMLIKAVNARGGLEDSRTGRQCRSAWKKEHISGQRHLERKQTGLVLPAWLIAAFDERKGHVPPHKHDSQPYCHRRPRARHCRTCHARSRRRWSQSRSWWRTRRKSRRPRQLWQVRSRTPWRA